MNLRSSLITKVTLAAVSAALLAGCAGRQAGTGSRPAPRKTHELLNAVLWMQTSPEYEFVCRQTYGLARLNLDMAISDPSWTAALEQTEGYEGLPPAVILDVDETVLDNSPFEASLILTTTEYNRPMWYGWLGASAARGIPGAKEFIHHALERGVDVFFVTNRDYDTEEVTVKNLQEQFGPAVTARNVLSRGEQAGWTSDKTTRRAYVAATHRVLLLIGDDYNDFASLGEPPPRERIDVARHQSGYWGTRWIILPNPMYGSWEQALYGYDRSMADEEKLRLKYESLNPAEWVVGGKGPGSEPQ